MTSEKAKTALKKYFGYDEFRPLQEEIIQSVYDGKDTVVIMPTGGGKSVCFQIPAVTMEGTALVVSPLIALMKDQVESMRAIGVKASFLNSSISSKEQYEIEGEFQNGTLDLLYVSPEKLASQDFQSVLGSAKISLFAIDEAHCISSWGHNFRPEYRQLKLLKTKFPNIPVIALTATADKVTRKDIGDQLNLVEPKLFLASFDRPNLKLEVRPGRKRWEQIVNFVANHREEAGIVYCMSRKNCESLAAKLQGKGLNADYYHAGMSSDQRNKTQEAFINDQIDIICATVAFGMGIDKSNIRWVIHYNLPKNIENFYQEIGRAGRDGAAADTMLFYSYADIMFLKTLIDQDGANGRELMQSKLDRLQQYATSPVCRRKTLLSYFGEYLADNCGNCDVCDLPPTSIDGTELAQMALSAVYRVQGQVNSELLINILRGSQRKDIFEHGFQNIKTYGVGRAYTYLDWRAYIEQLTQQGFLEIALDDGYKLKLTQASQDVLFKGLKVKLVKPASIKEREEIAEASAVTKQSQSETFSWDKDLFKRLKELRLRLAKEAGMPPYIIFGDKSLQEMAAAKPITREQFLTITGVGERKADQFSFDFLNVIKAYGQEKGIADADMFKPMLRASVKPKKPKVPKSAKVPTRQMTLEFYNKGLSLVEIARERGLKKSTLIDHLLYYHRDGLEIDFESMVDYDEELLKKIKDLVYQQEDSPPKMKPVFAGLNERVSYDEIKLYFAILEIRGDL